MTMTMKHTAPMIAYMAWNTNSSSPWSSTRRGGAAEENPEVAELYSTVDVYVELGSVVVVFSDVMSGEVS